MKRVGVETALRRGREALPLLEEDGDEVAAAAGDEAIGYDIIVASSRLVGAGGEVRLMA